MQECVFIHSEPKCRDDDDCHPHATCDPDLEVPVCNCKTGYFGDGKDKCEGNITLHVFVCFSRLIVVCCVSSASPLKRLFYVVCWS